MKFLQISVKFHEIWQELVTITTLQNPLQLETVSKCDGISSKFGEICQEFVTERSF